MKVVPTLTLATAVLAAPNGLEKRQRNCVAFVFARGSTEPAPLGLLVGLPLEPQLKRKIPTLKTFPVLYGASLATNVSPARTDAKSIQIGVTAFERAAKACSVIVAGGYSQGAAVMHNVISKRLSSDIKSRIAGVVLYGDTRNKQDGGQIPNFPADKVKVFCNKNDGVCGGMLVVNGGHLAYANQIGAGASFLAERVKSFRSGGGSESGGHSHGGSSGGEDGDAPEGGEAMEAPAGGLLGKLGALGKGGKSGKLGGGGKSGGLFGKLGGGGKRGGGSGGLSGLLGKLGGGS